MNDSNTPSVYDAMAAARKSREQAATTDDTQPTHEVSQAHPEDGPRGNRATQSGVSPPLDSTIDDARMRLLTQILKRARTSDHWVVLPGVGPSHRKKRLTGAALVRHLNGAERVGACPMERGASTTRLALFDLDSHKAAVPWPEMQATARRLIAAAAARGLRAIAVRSSGGHGIHLIFMWNEQQDARSVRALLADVLAECGLKNGTKGVREGQVEIFPKQDSVPADGWGSMFVLPFAGKSVALDPVTLEEIGAGAVKLRGSDDVPLVEPEPPREVAAPCDAPELDEIREALAVIDPNDFDYDGWLRILFSVHAGTDGGEEGLALILDWSARFERYDAQASAAETEKQWTFARSKKEGGITVGTLFAAARERGWVPPRSRPSAEGLEVIGENGEPVDVEAEKSRLLDVFVCGEQTDADCMTFHALPGQAQVLIMQTLELAATHEVMNAVRDAIERARESAAAVALPAEVSALLREIGQTPEDCGAACRAALVQKVVTVLGHSRVGESHLALVLQALKAKTGVGLTAVRRDVARLRTQVYAETGGLSLKNPTGNAAALVADRFTVDGVPALRRWQGEFFVWNGARYEAIGDEDARTHIYEFFRRGGLQVESRAAVDNTIDALRAEVNVPSTVRMPAWLGGQAPVDDLREVIPVGNGLLHVPTRTLHPHDPRFFSGHALAVRFDPRAPRPERWLAFLASVFPDDSESVALLQEWMGYLLTHDTSKQKALMMVGRTRSGKGTIARLISALVGEHDVCGPSLAALGTQFGLQQMIGKGLAIVSDARMSRLADVGAIKENLLRIIGEDTVSVPRKHLTDWTGKLPTRFMLASNTLPAIVDEGGALAGRFAVLRFEVSFLGREDARLDERLRVELPGILNWALEGRERLQARGETGQFTQPVSSEETIRELRRATTPLLAFIEDVVEFEPDAWVPKNDLFGAYGTWLHEQKVDGQRGGFSLPKEAFFREFYALAEGRATGVKRGPKGKQVPAVAGVRLPGQSLGMANDGGL